MLSDHGLLNSLAWCGLQHAILAHVFRSVKAINR